MYLGMGKYGVAMNPDAMDGHTAEREKILRAMNIPGANPVFMAGDSHNAWVSREGCVLPLSICTACAPCLLP
jgi:phosphodiesterase/alkaline phosphatase D-like protein